MRALRFYDIRNALMACLRRSVVIFPRFQRFGVGPVEFEKIAFVPSKFGYIYSVLMNKISIPNKTNISVKLYVCFKCTLNLCILM